MNPLTPEEQHGNGLAFWTRVARVWVKQDDPLTSRALADQAEASVRSALTQVTAKETRTAHKSILEELLAEDPE